MCVHIIAPTAAAFMVLQLVRPGGGWIDRAILSISEHIVKAMSRLVGPGSLPSESACDRHFSVAGAAATDNVWLQLQEALLADPFCVHQVFDLFAEDSRFNVYAGEREATTKCAHHTVAGIGQLGMTTADLPGGLSTW